MAFPDEEGESRYLLSTPLFSSLYSPTLSGVTGKDIRYSNGRMGWRDICGSAVPPLAVYKQQGLPRKQISRLISQTWTDTLAEVIAEDFHLPCAAIGRIFKFYTRITSHLYARVVKRNLVLPSGQRSSIYIMCIRTCNSFGDIADRKIYRSQSLQERRRNGSVWRGAIQEEQGEEERKEEEEEEMKEEDEEEDEEEAEEDCGIPLSVSGLTNRVLLIFNDVNVMTIRRTDLPSISMLRNEWGTPFKSGFSDAPSPSRRISEMMSFDFVNLLIRLVIQTYERPFMEDQYGLDRDFDRAMDASKKESTALIARSTRIKRRTQVILRVLLLHQKTLEKYLSLSGQNSIACGELLDDLDTLMELGTNLEEDAESFLDLHIMIKGHKVAKILRRLAFLTAVFYPATFITGMYGMNFEHFPALHWHYGYLDTWAVILTIMSLSLALFVYHGWLD
jgi:Mg2+ and Co2+ transporter CorA